MGVYCPMLVSATQPMTFTEAGLRVTSSGRSSEIGIGKLGTSVLRDRRIRAGRTRDVVLHAESVVLIVARSTGAKLHQGWRDRQGRTSQDDVMDKQIHLWIKLQVGRQKDLRTASVL